MAASVSIKDLRPINFLRVRSLTHRVTNYVYTFCHWRDIYGGKKVPRVFFVYPPTRLRRKIVNPCADKVEVILEMHLQIDLTSILSLGVKCESSDRNPTN